jgi:hypothetical protein
MPTAAAAALYCPSSSLSSPTMLFANRASMGAGRGVPGLPLGVHSLCDCRGRAGEQAAGGRCEPTQAPPFRCTRSRAMQQQGPTLSRRGVCRLAGERWRLNQLY